MSENGSLSALCRYEKTDVGPTLMGKTIRVDDTGEFFSVKDAIAAIEGVDSAAAKQSMRRLIRDKVISKGANTGFKPFKKGSKKPIMGARVSAIATMCAHLKGERAKAIYDRILQNGVRVFAGDVSLRTEIERNHERVDRAAADGDVLTAALRGTRHTEPSDQGECVTSSQLALRRMAQQALATDVERGNLTPAQIKNREREIRDDFASFARRYGRSGRSLDPAADVSLEPVKRVNPDDGETSGQLALSRMSRRALAIDVERGNLTPAQAEQRGREIRDATARFLERMYEDRTLM